MAKFITRIHLQQAEEKDYEKLNQGMEKAFFYLKKGYPAHSAEGVKKVEYNCRGNISLPDVANAVYRAVKKTGRGYSFTIMENKSSYTASRLI